jgi:chromate transport protein ChrA
MPKGIAVLLLTFSLTSSILLLPWLTIQQKSLTGAELSQILISLPAVAILLALIALYRRFSRVLVVSSGLSMLAAGILALCTNFNLSPASLQVQESVTGLAGESSLGAETTWPGVFAGLAMLSTLFSIWVATLPVSKKARVDEPGVDDARSIWDGQV